MTSEWFTTTIGEQATLQRGFDITKAAQQPGNIPVISSGGTNSYHSIAMVEGPGVVLGRKGVVGSVYYVHEDYWPHDTTLWVKDFHGNDAKFVYYFFLSRVKELAGLDVGSANPTLNRNHVHPIKVCWPSLKEQRKISAILTALDDRITHLRETNATLEAIAQALFKSWFVDFDPVRAKQEGRAPEGMDEATAALFPDGFEESELGAVPRGWRIDTLNDVAAYQNGYAFKTKDWQASGHPVVKIGNVKPGIIDISGCSYVAPEIVGGLDRFRLARGDLLVGMTGYVGETGLVPEIDPAAYLNQRVGRISVSDGIKSLGFVYCLVRNPAYKAYAESKGHGSAQANVSGADLMAYRATIPSQNVLDAFNTRLYPLIDKILSNYDQAQTLATLRDTLLPRLISGQLRLPEAEAIVVTAV